MYNESRDCFSRSSLDIHSQGSDSKFDDPKVSVVRESRAKMVMFDLMRRHITQRSNNALNPCTQFHDIRFQQYTIQRPLLQNPLTEKFF